MGGILRLLMIAAIIYLVYVWTRNLLNKQIDKQQVQKTSDNHQVMRKCAYCQVHLPESESTQSQGYFFCSEQHRDLYLQQK
jgi:uncharacterized protein